MKKVIVVVGVIAIILGIIIAVLFWPVMANPALGYYSGPSEMPDETTDLDLFYALGTVYDAKNIGIYAVLVVDFENDESLPIIEVGAFYTGDPVYVEYNFQEDFENGEWKSNIKLTDSEKDDILDYYDDYSESEIEDEFDSSVDNMKDFGLIITVYKKPDIGGYIGIAVTIMGIVLLIVGIVLKSKKKQAYSPPYQSDRAAPPPPRPRRSTRDYDDNYYNEPPPPPPPREYQDYNEYDDYDDDDEPPPPPPPRRLDY